MVVAVVVAVAIAVVVIDVEVLLEKTRNAGKTPRIATRPETGWAYNSHLRCFDHPPHRCRRHHRHHHHHHDDDTCLVLDEVEMILHEDEHNAW